MERRRSQEFHLFYRCPFVRALAFGSLWGFKIDALRAGSLEQLIDLLSIHRRKSLARKKTGFLTLLFYPLLFHCVWKGRNEKVFEGRKTLEQLLFCFNSAVMEFSEVSSLRLAEDFERELDSSLKGWSPPSPGRLKVIVDAAFREGQAGVAMVERDDQGSLIFFQTIVIPALSAYHAELLALDWVSAYAESLSWKYLVWCSDAKLIVDDINTRVDPNGWFSRIPILSV